MKYITQAWLVIFLALLYGGGLAGIQVALSEKIAENKKNETYSVLPTLVEGAEPQNTIERLVTSKKGRDVRIYQIFDASKKHIGWVLPANGQGFADRIELLVGLNADLSLITGIYVLEQKETPGLGDYISSKDFAERFRNKPANREIVIVKGDPTEDNHVRALTGATVSSVSVADIINKTMSNLKEPITQKLAEWKSTEGDA